MLLYQWHFLDSQVIWFFLFFFFLARSRCWCILFVSLSFTLNLEQCVRACVCVKRIIRFITCLVRKFYGYIKQTFFKIIYISFWNRWPHHVLTQRKNRLQHKFVKFLVIFFSLSPLLLLLHVCVISFILIKCWTAFYQRERADKRLCSFKIEHAGHHG